MALTAKSAHDNERQRFFEMIRHMVSGRHQVPADLSYEDLQVIYDLLWKSLNKGRY